MRYGNVEDALHDPESVVTIMIAGTNDNDVVLGIFAWRNGKPEALESLPVALDKNAE